MTTNILLTLIAGLLAVRIVLQLRQGKRAFENMYQAASEVQYHVEICETDVFAVNDKLRKLGKSRWEIAVIERVRVADEDCYVLFFTRKKIKNYYEE